MSAYHTAQCHGKPGCNCLSDHQAWVSELELPNAFERAAFWFCVSIAAVCTLIVFCGCLGYAWGRWGDAVTKFFN